MRRESRAGSRPIRRSAHVSSAGYPHRRALHRDRVGSSAVHAAASARMRKPTAQLVAVSTVGVVLAGCGSGGLAAPVATNSGVVAHWQPALHVTQVVDLTPPRTDGRLVVAANGRLA